MHRAAGEPWRSRAWIPKRRWSSGVILPSAPTTANPGAWVNHSHARTHDGMAQVARGARRQGLQRARDKTDR